jgi:hypothetical protein
MIVLRRVVTLKRREKVIALTIGQRHGCSYLPHIVQPVSSLSNLKLSQSAAIVHIFIIYARNTHMLLLYFKKRYPRYMIRAGNWKFI